MKLYVTFGQIHEHCVANKFFDANCVAEIDCEDYADGRAKAFDAFGSQFAFSYLEDQIKDSLHLFPRGIIKLEDS